ncbi:MAG TPA: hypothetical protein VMZ03_09560 [Chitinophagaceae bacterium]|nr:hypothetical protein [Chitinophagaceae bacterium]
MERIEALIRKLNEQFEQNADPALLLGTVQLLGFELTKLNSGERQSLGTPKVAVVLPMASAVTHTGYEQYEKFAPKPAEQVAQPAAKEPDNYRVKETLLVDEGSVSVVQKNGQLDMLFDPMTEIPTLSQHSKEKEVNDRTGQGESVNDKLKQGKTELVERLKETPVKDLRKAVGINDRFLFINELFRGDESMYERCIKTINSFNIFPEAEYWITRELKVKLGWNNDSPTVQHFDQLVKRRFS